MRRCPRLSDHRPPSTPLFPYTTLFRSDILFYQTLDRPGILASVAGALASQGINIGALSLGRSGQGAQAITAIVVDKKLDPEELQPVYDLEGVEHVKYVSLSRSEERRVGKGGRTGGAGGRDETKRVRV